ncbi:MAG: hypothetical protein HQL34_06635 [Alphaproteobacteria bacterium]|nr:hypothetical protein [Alphaproteobacteria bacterium]
MPGVRLELTTYRLPSHFGFRRPRLGFRRYGVRGLDYPFAVANRGFRRHPSSLYTFPRMGAWLGIGVAS